VSASAEYGETPIVDLQVLYELEDEFDDATAVHAFVRDFVGIWDGRYGKLARTVRAGDKAAAKDAVLSVRTACTMIGATLLAELTVEMEEHIDTGNFAAAEQLLPDIEDIGRLSVQALQEDYVNRKST
jgi:hypothetical protein